MKRTRLFVFMLPALALIWSSTILFAHGQDKKQTQQEKKTEKVCTGTECKEHAHQAGAVTEKAEKENEKAKTGPCKGCSGCGSTKTAKTEKTETEKK